MFLLVVILAGLFLDEGGFFVEAVRSSYAVFLAGMLGVYGLIFRSAPRLRQAITSWVIFIFVFATMFAVVSLLIYVLSMLGTTFESRHDLIPWGFENKRHWSHIATWSLPLLPLMITSTRQHLPEILRPYFTVASYFAGGIWCWILLASMARGSLVSLLAGFVLIHVIFRTFQIQAYRTVFARMVLIGVVLWIVLEQLIPLSLGVHSVPDINLTTSGRLPLWRESWALSLEAPVSGSGLLSWLTHVPLTDTYQNMRVGHPHNMYLLWAAELGWLVIIPLVIFALQVFRSLRGIATNSKPTREQLEFLPAFTFSVAAAAVHASVSAVFLAPMSLLYALFTLPLFLVLLRSFNDFPRQTSEPSLLTRLMRFTAVFVLFSMLVYQLIGSVGYYYKEMFIDKRCLLQEGRLGRMYPRFWLHGDFPRPPSLACDQSRIPEDVRRVLD